MLRFLCAYIDQASAMEVRDVNGVPTHVFSMKATSGNETPLLYVVPGSPGMAHFYVPFATRLFQLGGGAYDVSVVSHAGHSPGVYRRPPPGASDEGDHTRDWYDLDDQIAHKLAFLHEAAPHKKSLYLVGHSIGCYMILRMLGHLSPTRVKKIFFLFPTIEKMAVTPNGLSQHPLFTSLRSSFTGAVWLMGGVPQFVKQIVLKLWFWGSPQEHVDHMCRAAINIDNRSIYNILSMAEQEMKEVVELPVDVIQEHIDKMVFYYGMGDKWNVESCYTDMVKLFPGKDITLCTEGYEHSFVINSSDPMAEYVHRKLPNE